MSGGKRDPAHRAIIYGGILGGLSRDDVNKMLAKAGARDLGETSYRSVRDHYVPYFKGDLSRLGKAIQHPPTWSDLKKAGSRTPPSATPDSDPTADE